MCLSDTCIKIVSPTHPATPSPITNFFCLSLRSSPQAFSPNRERNTDSFPGQLLVIGPILSAAPFFISWFFSGPCPIIPSQAPPSRINNERPWIFRGGVQYPTREVKIFYVELIFFHATKFSSDTSSSWGASFPGTSLLLLEVLSPSFPFSASWSLEVCEDFQ